MAWTDEMVEELKKLWDEGVTTGEIGRRLGISKNSIVGKVHRLGLSGRPSPIKKKSDAPSSKDTKPQPKEKKTTAPSPKKETKCHKEPEIKKDAVVKPQAEKNIQPAKPTTPPVKPSILPSPDEEDIKLAKSLNPAPATEPKEHLSLTDLDNHTCRWPVGDPKDDNFHFCGRKIKLGQTYCEEHSAIAYVKPGRK